ncbi:MAG: two-component regulator propeller domain-containing protein, partial [Ignavibacteriales bacterium]
EIEAVVQSSQTSNYTELLRDTSEWIDYQVFNSGIQTNSLTAIALDNNSTKWIGTLDRGLIRFDELSFQNFTTLNSPIPGNKINCISIDNQNRVWVGTDFGIGVYNGISWTIYNSDNSGLISETIKTMKFDSGGNCWIGTTANLVKFDGINWTVYNEPSSGDWINDIYIEALNKLWIGTKSNGIFIFENEIFTPVLQPAHNYPSKTISSIASDGLNNIWFCFLPDTAGRGGASYWNGSSFTNFLFGTPQNNINHIFIDGSDNKWFATSEGFLVLDPQNSSMLFNTFNSLISADNIGASARDENGNVWITTTGGGLNKYKPQP